MRCVASGQTARKGQCARLGGITRGGSSCRAALYLRGSFPWAAPRRLLVTPEYPTRVGASESLRMLLDPRSKAPSRGAPVPGHPALLPALLSASPGLAHYHAGWVPATSPPLQIRGSEHYRHPIGCSSWGLVSFLFQLLREFSLSLASKDFVQTQEANPVKNK